MNEQCGSTGIMSSVAPKGSTYHLNPSITVLLLPRDPDVRVDAADNVQGGQVVERNLDEENIVVVFESTCLKSPIKQYVVLVRTAIDGKECKVFRAGRR